MSEIIFKNESYVIIGACMEVHKKLGAGFLESVYSEALEKEFEKMKIPFQRGKKLKVYYDSQPMKKYFMADFVCFDTIIVELKSKSFITENDQQQSLNYLKATNFKLAILINFGTSSLTSKRIVN